MVARNGRWTIQDRWSRDGGDSIKVETKEDGYKYYRYMDSDENSSDSDGDSVD